MEATNLQIYWHESQPVYSITFRGSQADDDNDDENFNEKGELFTAGGDNKVRLWRLNCEETGKGTCKVDTIDFLSGLSLHEQAVNVIRFDHGGHILASAGDDGQVLLWKLTDEETRKKQQRMGDEPVEGDGWAVWKRLRGTANDLDNMPGGGASEIYDLSWSPDDKYLVTASMDNSLKVFNVDTGNCVAFAKDHNHYVQGVTWDPLNQYIISQSVDRSINIYEIELRDSKDITSSTTSTELIKRLKLKNRIFKSELPFIDEDASSRKIDYSVQKSSYLYHNETLPSFFRRLVMSPCGSLLVVPTGLIKNHPTSTSIGTKDDGEESSQSNSNNTSASSDFNNAVFIYTRAAIKQNLGKPSICLPFFKKPAVAVAFSPIFYERTSNKPYVDLPYKLVFAIATINQVIFYDTENIEPISIVSNLHYTPLTDLTWSPRGDMVMVSSTDGFCSAISINTAVFGRRTKKPSFTNTIVKEEISLNREDASEVKQPKRSHDIINILPVRKKSKVDTNKSTTDSASTPDATGNDKENKDDAKTLEIIKNTEIENS
ncbi:uncharacterized protein HLK63_J06391 [Nakaseomyces glabratus]|nr:uncharacterized protein GW608_J06391 [Nakaseomyces glabratus]UCS27020.1 uncharacterized protein HLK63_J06391 [Nakaseomyces glabratus]UCS32249.1 uncharacterized protein HLK64_J06391 [Nakaseomyces glabratus]UCS37478.1 uncharacterized protein HLK62_J06391 [Nakaseomyces glabratus]